MSKRLKSGLESGLSGDLLAIDIRQALYHFGEITGEITNDDLLGNIFYNLHFPLYNYFYYFYYIYNTPRLLL